MNSARSYDGLTKYRVTGAKGVQTESSIAPLAICREDSSALDRCERSMQQPRSRDVTTRKRMPSMSPSVSTPASICAKWRRSSAGPAVSTCRHASLSACQALPSSSLLDTEPSSLLSRVSRTTVSVPKARSLSSSAASIIRWMTASRRQKAVNRAHARIRVRGERADATPTPGSPDQTALLPPPRDRDRAGHPRPAPRREPDLPRMKVAQGITAAGKPLEGPFRVPVRWPVARRSEDRGQNRVTPPAL